MKVSNASKIWLNYHHINSKKNTYRCYSVVMGKFCEVFEDHQLDEITVDDIMDFLNQLTDGCKPQTKRIRYSHLSAFFNFAKNNLDSDFSNPCDSPMLRKLIRAKVKTHWDNIEKDTVDEIIFRTTKLRNRLLLELMARGAMRFGEVLKLTPNDIAGRKLLLREPKSGSEFEIDNVRRIAYECRVLFFNAKGRRSSVPLNWTDIGPIRSRFCWTFTFPVRRASRLGSSY